MTESIEQSNHLGCPVLFSVEYPDRTLNRWTTAFRLIAAIPPYPDAKNGLNRWLPLIKWLLAIPHYIVLFFLFVGAIGAVIAAWFAILLTGRYPRVLFDYLEGVGRWNIRVFAYSIMLVTDEYPPFRLRP